MKPLLFVAALILTPPPDGLPDDAIASDLVCNQLQACVMPAIIEFEGHRADILGRGSVFDQPEIIA